jgi:hypothetical protein
MEYQEFPKCMYHADGRVVNVNDASEESALGAEWMDCKAYVAFRDGLRDAPIIGVTGLPSAADLDAVEAEKELARPATRKPPKKAR